MTEYSPAPFTVILFLYTLLYRINIITGNYVVREDTQNDGRACATIFIIKLVQVIIILAGK